MINFIKNNLIFFQSKHALSNYPFISNELQEHYFLLKDVSCYKNLSSFLIQINKSFILEKEEKNILAKAFSYRKTYTKDGVDKYFNVKFNPNEILFIKVKRGMLNNQQQLLIYLNFYFNKPLYAKLKTFPQFTYLKNQQCFCIPFKDETIIEIIKNGPSIIFDLDGCSIYQKKFKKSIHINNDEN